MATSPNGHFSKIQTCKTLKYTGTFTSPGLFLLVERGGGIGLVPNVTDSI